MLGFTKTQQYSFLKQESEIHFLKFIAMGFVVIFSTSVTTYLALKGTAPLFVVFNSIIIGYSLNTTIQDLSAYRSKRAKMKELTLEIMERFANSHEEVKTKVS